MSLCLAPLLPLYSSSQGCHTATGTHMPHGITQCYLPPARGDIPALTPAKAGTRLSDPGGMQGWVVCVSVCQVMSVVCQYLPLKEDLDEHVTVYRCISHLYHSHLPHVSNYINVQNNYCLQCFGRQEGHPACKKTEWWGADVVICLERGADLHMAQLMPLPLTVSCFSKIQIGFTFLVLLLLEKGR